MTVQEPEREEWEPRKLKFGDQVSAVCWHHPLSDESLRFDGTFVKPFPNAPANYAWVLPNGNKWNEKDPSAIGCAVRACKWESLRPLSPPPVAIGDFVEGLTDGKFKQDTGVAVCGFVIGSAELNIAIGLLPADAVPFATITRKSVRLIKKAPPPVGSAGKAAPESWGRFKVGDRIRMSKEPLLNIYTIVGYADDGSDWALLSREGGKRNDAREDGYFYGDPSRFELAQETRFCSAEALSVFGAEAVRSPAGGGSSKPDPYREHRRSKLNGVEYGSPFDNIAPEQTSRLEEGIAAHRRRLAQATEQLNRKVEPRHPSDFEVDDSPSNVWCNGKP